MTCWLARIAVLITDQVEPRRDFLAANLSSLAAKSPTYGLGRTNAMARFGACGSTNFTPEKSGLACSFSTVAVQFAAVCVMPWHRMTVDEWALAGGNTSGSNMMRRYNGTADSASR